MVWLRAVAVAAAVVVLPVVPASGSGGPRRQPRVVGSHGLGALPAQARGRVSRALGRDDPRYAVHPRADGWVARNPAQGLDASFGRAGALVRSDGLTWSLGLRAVGYGAALTSLQGVAARGDANRVVFARRGLQEWYANGPLGIEQGFTLSRRPAPGRGGPLTLALGLPAGSRARFAHGELVLERSGRARLRYSGLVATDAHGRRLGSWLQARPGRLLIRVDDRGARYRVRIDPFVRTAKLTASNGATGDELGYSSAVSSDGLTVAAGAPNRGSVYVFERPPSGWGDATETRELSGSGQQGYSVAVSGDGSTVVAGAPGAGAAFAAFVFVRQSGSWRNVPQTTKLLAATGDHLGSSVAVSSDGLTIVAGAPDAAIGPFTFQGAAYVFEKGTGWSFGAANQKARLLAAGGGGGADQLGSSVAVSDDGLTAIAGGPGSNGSRGIVYVFARGSGWSGDTTQAANLTASDGLSLDQLGHSAALSGDGSTVVAGAPATVAGPSQSNGAAYVFTRPAGGWATSHETAKLTASDGAHGDDLGYSVAVSDDGSAALAGAPYAATGANASQGAVYAFSRPTAGLWATTSTPAAKLTAPDGGNSDKLGWSVAVSGTGSTAVAGAFEAMRGTNSDGLNPLEQGLSTCSRPRRRRRWPVSHHPSSSATRVCARPRSPLAARGG